MDGGMFNDFLEHLSRADDLDANYEIQDLFADITNNWDRLTYRLTDCFENPSMNDLMEDEETGRDVFNWPGSNPLYSLERGLTELLDKGVELGPIREVDTTHRIVSVALINLRAAKESVIHLHAVIDDEDERDNLKQVVQELNQRIGKIENALLSAQLRVRNLIREHGTTVYANETKGERNDQASEDQGAEDQPSTNG